MASQFATYASITERNLRDAKAKALACLHQEQPKLTALERAFWLRARQLHLN